MAVIDYFLRIDGVQGESADAKHKGEIDVQSWSWGEANTGAHGTGGGGAGRVDMHDLHFAMRTNRASPTLLLACATGQTFKAASLICRKAGKDQQEFLRFDFSDLLVSSYQTGGEASDVVPTDEVSLKFSKIQVEYREQRPDGTLGASIRVGWDTKQNKVF